MSKRAATNKNGFADDKLPDAKVVQEPAYSKNFGDIQVFFYLFSCMGMTLYFIHFLTSCYGVAIPINRPYTHGLLEVVLLVTRTMNEVYHDKIGLGDWGHHLAMVFGFYIVVSVESCMSYDWLICHMQVLHFPMLCWYFGCRKNSYLEKYFPHSPDLKKYSIKLFPVIMIASAGYRAGLMVLSAWQAYIDGTYLALSIIITIGALLIYLDKGWTEYFLDLLGWPAFGTSASYYLCGVLGSIFSAIYSSVC